ncbi:hypothetical protein MPSEU_000195800 [Mayamaea pseudoterrestris]|nr:hypothetical protein MPSEU_000195800 [Mayamaea pseudoterrestris]
MEDPPIRRLTRSKSTDEMPPIRPPRNVDDAASQSSTASQASSVLHPLAPSTVTDIDSPRRSPRRQAPPRAASAAVLGRRAPPRTLSGALASSSSTRRQAPSRTLSAAAPGRKAPPIRRMSGMGELSSRGPLSRTHTGDGMSEMAAWRQQQLAGRLNNGNGGPAPPVRTHSKITDLAKLREQQQMMENGALHEEGSDMSDDESSVAEFRESEDESETIEEESSDEELIEEDDEDDDDDD